MAGSTKAASPFGKSAGAASPFGNALKAKSPSGPPNPFTGAGNAKLFKEMDSGLNPYMQPDQMDEKPWWQNITLGQAVGTH